MLLFLTFVLQFFDENRNKNLNEKRKSIKKNIKNILCSIDNEWNIQKAYANKENYFSLTLF